MRARDVILLYDYNYWADRRILSAAERMSLEQLLAPTGHSFGSLRGTLVHILDAECGWRMLREHKTLSSFRKLKEDGLPGLEPLRQLWIEEERAMRDYLARLGDADMDGYVRYTADGLSRTATSRAWRTARWSCSGASDCEIHGRYRSSRSRRWSGSAGVS